MERIGIRELRQHASRYLRRVAGGETLEVTDQGHPVARLVPVPSDPWENLLASGLLQEPDEPGDVLDEQPGEYGIDASANLRAMRDDER